MATGYMREYADKPTFFLGSNWQGLVNLHNVSPEPAAVKVSYIRLSKCKLWLKFDAKFGSICST